MKPELTPRNLRKAIRDLYAYDSLQSHGYDFETFGKRPQAETNGINCLSLARHILESLPSKTTNLTFGEALNAMLAGKVVILASDVVPYRYNAEEKRFEFYVANDRTRILGRDRWPDEDVTFSDTQILATDWQIVEVGK
jgi:hypothetical protein